MKKIFNFTAIFPPPRKGLTVQPKGFPGRYTAPGMRGCFRGCSRRVFEVRITLSKSLTRSRQFRNEIHGDPYTEAFTRRFNLERGRSLRGPRLSPKSDYYAIYGLSGRISATLFVLLHGFYESDPTLYTDLSRIVIRCVYRDLRLSIVVGSIRKLILLEIRCSAF